MLPPAGRLFEVARRLVFSRSRSHADASPRVTACWTFLWCMAPVAADPSGPAVWATSDVTRLRRHQSPLARTAVCRDTDSLGESALSGTGTPRVGFGVDGNL